MPFLNEHAARVKSPGLFIKDSMRSKSISNGIRLIAGKLKSKPDVMTPQSYRFNKSIFTADAARKWLSEHKISTIGFEAVRSVQSLEKSIKLQCYAMAISPQEIRSNIPINVMAEIKEGNPHPYFRAYSIMHEGIARPRVIGEDNSLPTKWGRKIVESLSGIIKRGVQFFVGHNNDNSTVGRRSIGEVVANFQKRIGDKLHNIVVGYFPDRLEADKYNVCSIEGNILAQDYDDYSIVKKIKDITGIALGNSINEKPAFPGAVYLGAVQAFDDNGEDTPASKNKEVRRSQMTFEEIKKSVKDMNIFPAQLYTEDDLKNDRTFGKIFDEVAKATKEKDDFETKLTEKDNEIKKLQKDMALATAHDKLNKSFPEGLTESQRKFIGKKFNPEKMEDLGDENIKEFIDGSLKEYSEYASIFGNSKTENTESQDDSVDAVSNEVEDGIDKIVNDVIKNPQGV